MKTIALGTLLGVMLPAAVALPQGIAIEHNAVGCIVADKFPKLLSCFKPSSTVGQARVYFRAKGTAPWYYVTMKSEMHCYVGVLPKPRPTTPAIEYYIEVTDRSLNTARTAEYAPVVVADAMTCRKEMLMAAALPKASVAVSAAAGAPAAPPGFAGGATVTSAGTSAPGASSASS